MAIECVLRRHNKLAVHQEEAENVDASMTGREIEKGGTLSVRKRATNQTGVVRRCTIIGCGRVADDVCETGDNGKEIQIRESRDGKCFLRSPARMADDE